MIVKVEFEWDDRFGPCYDCGRPAAYEIDEPKLSREARLRCSTCAATAAAEGERIVWLFAEPCDTCAEIDLADFGADGVELVDVELEKDDG